jgi:hypothetical protein
MLTIFGGYVPDLTIMLSEERFPQHWEPRITSRFGLTMTKFNATILGVETRVNTKKVEQLEADGKAKVAGGDPVQAQETTQEVIQTE